MTTKIKVKGKPMHQYEVIVVGAGPIGLACALELSKYDIDYVIIEKGCVVNSIYHFPQNMTFFTYNYDIAISNIPFNTEPKRPSRDEVLAYYRSVVDFKGLSIRLYEKVLNIKGKKGDFTVITSKAEIKTGLIFIATGYYDNPNHITACPCLTHPLNNKFVSHYYTHPHPYFKQNIVIIGGGNSAAEAALDLYRHNVKVTLVHRGPDLKKAVKNWIMPDIKKQIRDGTISAFFNSEVISISEEERSVILNQKDQEIILENVSFVFILTGYHPDYTFFKKIGLEINESNGKIIFANPENNETTVPGIYVIGSAGHGKQLNKIFIENGKFEAKRTVDSIIDDLFLG